MNLTYAQLAAGRTGRRSMSPTFRAVLEQLEAGPSYPLAISRVVGLVPAGVSAVCERMRELGLATAHPELGDPHRLGRPLRRYYALTDRGRDLARTELHRR